MLESPALSSIVLVGLVCFACNAPVARGAILHFFETVLGGAEGGGEGFFAGDE
jgi:hypothetical protein